MASAKHTQGEWKYDANVAEDYFPIYQSNGLVLATVEHSQTRNGATGLKRSLTPSERAEAEANAHLIAEAGNVANESGLTPRQLLEQRNELLEACKIALKAFNGEYAHWTHKPVSKKQCAETAKRILEEAITKATGK